MDINGWTEITHGSADPKSIQVVVAQILEEAGVPVKLESSRPPVVTHAERPRSGSKYFGVSIYSVQETLPYVIGESTVRLPKVFVQAVKYLEANTKCEGLFRKAGSVARQKSLRASLEAGHNLSDPNPHDVAGLLKQYIRELPEPLTTKLLSPVFQRCQHLGSNSSYHTLLACLLLPEENLRMLKVLVRLLAMVAADHKHSLMDSASLAIVMAPNFVRSLQSGGGGGGEGAGLKEYTALMETLILNAGVVGMAPKAVLSRALASGRLGQCDDHSNVVMSPRYQKKKRRSASFSGIVEGLSHRLKGKNVNAQSDGAASNGTLKPKIVNNGEVHLCKKPAHLPTGRSGSHTLQVKGHRRGMSFLNKLWPTSTDGGNTSEETTPSMAPSPTPSEKLHLQKQLIGLDKYKTTPSQKVLLIGYSKLQSNPRPRINREIPLTPLQEEEPRPHLREGGDSVPLWGATVPSAELFAPLVVDVPLAPDLGVSGSSADGTAEAPPQANRRLSLLAAADRRKSLAKGPEKPLMDGAFRMPADSPLLLPPSQLRVSLSYPDLTPTSRRIDGPLGLTTPIKETTPFKCNLKYSASMDSGSVKRPGGVGWGRGGAAWGLAAPTKPGCLDSCAPEQPSCVPAACSRQDDVPVEERGERGGVCGDLSVLAHSPEEAHRITAEMAQRQQCYLYDSYANRIQKMNTSYCHAVSNRSSSSQGSSADGDRHLPSTPSQCGGRTPLMDVHKMADKVKTPVSLLRGKRKPDIPPFLLALTPSWKRAKREGQRNGEEAEKLSERAQLYLVHENAVSSPAQEDGGKENTSHDGPPPQSSKDTRAREWIV